MKRIELTKGMSALVDDGDYPSLMLYRWKALKTSKRGRWYAVRKEGGMAIYMHRQLLGHGDYITDHKNGDGLDNRRANLRKASAKQNAWNISKKKNGTTSSYKGVGWVKKDNAFQARIRTPRGRISLGYFHDDRDAARAYNAKAIEICGEFAKLNVV